MTLPVKFRRYQCFFCAEIYDEEKGWPEEGIAPGTRWENVSDDWVCPGCGAAKTDFYLLED